jgi:membrane protein DedA with SNARE-associated domain
VIVAASWRRHARGAAAGALLALVLALLAAAVLVEGTHDAADDAAHFVAGLEPRFGPAASFVGLYLEESGVPLPIFGDALVVYLGHRFAGSPGALAAVWLGLIATTVAGSSNLYLIARLWGGSLLRGRFGLLLDVTPRRVESAERWFGRWGALAIVIGRHVLGFRIPVTVGAGLFRVPYPVFAASVAVSTAIWAAAWLALGVVFGDRIGRFVGHHHWTYALLPVGVVALVVLAARRAWLERRGRRTG